jgi:hypothetical protein
MSKNNNRSANSSGVSTVRSMSDRLAATAKGASNPKPSAKVKVVVQKHTREDAQRSINSLRKKVAELYGKGKFSTAALMVPVTDLDNATYYMCCGEFDRSVEICHHREMNLNA